MVRTTKTTHQVKILLHYITFLLSLTLAPFGAFADETNVDTQNGALLTPYPSLWEMPTYIYEDYMVAYDRVFTEEAVPYWWAVGITTAITLVTDDKWIEESQRFGKRLGISSRDNTTTVAEYKGVTLLRLPQDAGSFMYFIGDGWTHAAIAAGFLGSGAWTDDDETFNIGFQLVEGMVTTTIATQFLKHVTGRESPSEATTRTGRWDFLPDQRAYFDNVAKYDAYPSGHLAVSSMTLTVLHKNYPDNPWILPTGVTLLSMLSFQMMNNEVHWASDYPLAIALGYTFGSISYERGQRALERGEAVSALQWIPIVGKDEVGVGLNYQF